MLFQCVSLFGRVSSSKESFLMHSVIYFDWFYSVINLDYSISYHFKFFDVRFQDLSWQWSKEFSCLFYGFLFLLRHSFADHYRLLYKVSVTRRQIKPFINGSYATGTKLSIKFWLDLFVWFRFLLEKYSEIAKNQTTTGHKNGELYFFIFE